MTVTNACGQEVVTNTLTVGNPPNIVVTPESLSAEQCPDTVTTQTLSICNVGTAPLVWSLSEVSGVVGLATSLPAASDGGPSPSLDIPWLEESPTGGAQGPGVCISVTVRFDSTGLSPITYTAGLLVESNDPEDPQIGIPVTLTVIAPASGADFAWTPVTPTVGELVHFTGTVASGNPPLTYTWDWGDGHTEVLTEPTALHTYTAAGTYTVFLTVTNACGLATAARDLWVRPALPPFHIIYLPLVFKGYSSP